MCHLTHINFCTGSPGVSTAYTKKINKPIPKLLN